MEYTRIEKLHIFLDLFEGLDYEKKFKLISLYSDSLEILSNFNKDQRIKDILDGVYSKIEKCFNPEFVNSAIENYNKKGIKIVTIDSSVYPSPLKRLFKPPFILYCLGDTSLLNSRCISIVGSRDISKNAKSVTGFFAGELASHGLTIVSGMARGADTAAHNGALAASGKTIAVLAGGFDNIYPSENYELFKTICKCGLVISEHSPAVKNLPHMFLIRNRIVAGLSQGLLVTYAKLSSGTQSTVEYALEMGMDLYILPGDVSSKESMGSNQMLKATSGALVTEPSDILKNLNIEYKVRNEKPEIDLEENEILQILGLEKVHYSDIINKLNIDAGALNATLSKMEIKGLILKLSGNFYKIK